MEANQEPKKKKNLNVIFIIAAVLIMAGLTVWYINYYQSNTYFKTDNAKVSADLYTMTPATAGKLVKLTVAQGSTVKANEVIARVENGPYIKSPVDGQVVKCDVTLNQIVSPTTAVAVIADTGGVNVTANIEETDIIKINDGQQVTLDLDAYPGKKFHGHVRQLDKVTQSALSGNMTSFTTSGTYTKVTQLIPVKIELDDEVDLTGVIGTNATVKIKVR